MGLGADDDSATALLVGLQDAVAAEDDGPGREVRALNDHGQAGEIEVGVVDQRHGGVDDLAQIVRRDIRGHADGDAARPVDQQVRILRRQDRGLVAALVVVRPEVDRVLVDVGQQRIGDLGEPGLGVAHGRRRIAVHRAEIALPVDQRQAHAEVLRHADQSIVDRGIAVRVVLAHHVADDQRRLAVRPAEIVAGVAHGVEDAPLHRLEPVADVGQSAADDHAHGVIEVAALHLLLDRDDLEGARRKVAGHGGKSRQVKELADTVRRL